MELVRWDSRWEGRESRLFLFIAFPAPTHDGAGTPDSEFGGWGVAGVPVSALARVLAPIEPPRRQLLHGS